MKEDSQIALRFDRLEVKIDKLTEVMLDVARVEEQILGINARLKRQEFRLDENERKLDVLSETAAKNSLVAKIGGSLAASIWAAIVAALIYFFKD
mgnify:CR=1 FL=1|tara:strand:- start:651 stop:935 length:285 start_codon:yes stop_codon:yes gene_type:complete